VDSRLAKRLLFGALLIALVGGALWVDHREVESGGRPIWSPLLAVAISLAALRELLDLLSRAGCLLPRTPMLLAGATFLLAKVVVEFEECEPRAAWLAAASAAVVTIVVALLLLDRDVEHGVLRSGGAALFILVAQLLSTLIDVVYDFGTGLLFALILSVKAGDMGAYLAGKSLGRVKLIPHVSPGKTVEGAIGGLIAALAMAWWLLERFGAGRFTVAERLAVGALLFVAGHVGDLFESLWKRAAKVKDSGRLLPEFGGALDLVDSLLFALPAGYAALRLLDG
jgi:CDP-diglyceride synthetase